MEQTEAVDSSRPWTEEDPDWLVSVVGGTVAPFKPNSRPYIAEIALQSVAVR